MDQTLIDRRSRRRERTCQRTASPAFRRSWQPLNWERPSLTLLLRTSSPKLGNWTRCGWSISTSQQSLTLALQLKCQAPPKRLCAYWIMFREKLTFFLFSFWGHCWRIKPAMQQNWRRNWWVPGTERDDKIKLFNVHLIDWGRLQALPSLKNCAFELWSWKHKRNSPLISSKDRHLLWILSMEILKWRINKSRSNRYKYYWLSWGRNNWWYQDQVDECQRKLTGMEGNLADQTVRERIRDVEKAQSIAELKQIISNLEFQVGLTQMPMKQCCWIKLLWNENFNLSSLLFLQNQQLVKNSEERDQLMNLEDKMSSLRQQASCADIPTIYKFSNLFSF